MLISIRNKSSSNKLVCDIQHTLLSTFSKGISIRFLWIPGHVDILGNSKADELARAGSSLATVTPLAATVEEATRVVADALATHAQLEWDTDVKGRHMHGVKPIRGNWPSCSQTSRRREVVLARLRLGHTLHTHSYLLSNEQSTPLCDSCRVPLTVKHILLDCNRLTQFRAPILRYASSVQLPLSLQLLLGDDHPTLKKLLFKFLDNAQLTAEI